MWTNTASKEQPPRFHETRRLEFRFGCNQSPAAASLNPELDDELVDPDGSPHNIQQQKCEANMKNKFGLLTVLVLGSLVACGPMASGQEKKTDQPDPRPRTGAGRGADAIQER